jgi:protein phosphatase
LVEKKPAFEVALELISQVCQLFEQVYQQGWCFYQVIPQFIQVDSTISFFDLINVRLVGEQVLSSNETKYCPPETAKDYPISEGTSTYIIGTLLYQAIYQRLPPLNLTHSYLDKQPIPGIYQLISLCLSPIIEERISLNQLVKVLRETKETFSNCKV